MSVSRDNILTIIRQKNGVTVDRVSSEMQFAAATVRRHLDILERGGLVVHSEIRKPAGPYQYSCHLTEQGHDRVPKDYGRSLTELVSEIKNIPTSELSDQSGSDMLCDSVSRIGA